MDRYDVAVVGAGFGGLATALACADAGAKVVLLEQLRYPGGCASTFTRQGARFESGATLFSGFGEGQLFDAWIRRFALPGQLDAIDPVIELRAPGFTLPIRREHERFLEGLLALPGVPEGPTRAFFREQRAVADVLWSLFDDPALLPPLSWRALLTHVGRLPRYLPLVRHVGRTLERALRRHGVHDCVPLRTYVDAVCQITVQASSAEVEAPFALGAMDYGFRGTGHVHGGIGELAWALASRRSRERAGAGASRPGGATCEPISWSPTSRLTRCGACWGSRRGRTAGSMCSRGRWRADGARPCSTSCSSRTPS